MRIYADVNRFPDLLAGETSSVIIQVAGTPEVNTATPINGKFVVGIPDGVTPPVITSASRLLDPSVPPGILPTIYNSLLAQYPTYGNILYNPILNASDIAKLDATAVFPWDPGPPIKTWSSRFQTGTPLGGTKGVAPNSVAVLPENSTTTPIRPGVLITDKIDIAAYTGGLGASSFVVYWKVYQMSVTNDVMNYTSGVNTPALKNLIEVDQDILDVFLSCDNGVGYTQASRLATVSTGVPGNDVRLAFINHTRSKVYVTAYAVMF
ncbi:MAG: hypothetical protein A3J97_05910 [Spirochaetes bacterium RIFOXYC1_FULL_54_7]|nr:MAG: hypothetical protein A3J97_05910 [Spirochaetes bacterium RIFOXYC1_FULL_54_7]